MSRIVGRVVVGVNGSPESLHALRHGVELARQYDAILIAVNAQPVSVRGLRQRRRAGFGGVGGGLSLSGLGSGIWQHTACTVVRTAFDESLGGLPRDVECVLLAAPGSPGPALLAVAERANDVLVLGAPRRSRATRLIRRGVAAYCLDHAHCSVLTIPAPPLAVRARALARVPR